MSSNRNKIVEVLDINCEQIQFAQDTNKHGVTYFKDIDKHKDNLIGKYIFITVVNERGRRLVFTLRIDRIDNENETNSKSNNKRLIFTVLETGKSIDKQTNVITKLINEPNTNSNIKLLNTLILGDTTNTSSNRGKARNNMSSEQWEQLFDSKLDTQGYDGGVYLISGTVNGIKYYYIGVTDDYKQRFKQHWFKGQGGRYDITSDMILQADDGTMKAIVVKHEVFDKEYMEHVMETVFTSLFEFTGVKVVNSLDSGKYKSRNELIQLLITHEPCEVQILWDSYELVKSYELYITDNDLYYMEELYKLAHKQGIPSSVLELLDELQVTLNEFIEYIQEVEVKRRGFGKITEDKMKPTSMPKGRSKNRFDGYLGYKYNETSKFNKSKPYYKYHNGKYENLSIKDMEQLVEVHVKLNKYAILDIDRDIDIWGHFSYMEVTLTGRKKVIIKRHY